MYSKPSLAERACVSGVPATRPVATDIATDIGCDPASAPVAISVPETLLDAIMNARSLPQLWRVIRGYYRAMGFAGCCYVLPSELVDGASRELCAGYPGHWLRQIDPAALLQTKTGSTALFRRDMLILPVFGANERNGWLVLGLMKETGVVFDHAALHMVAQLAHTRGMQLIGPARTPRAPCLSAREQEILQWIAHGKSKGVIAGIIGISAATVDTHVRRIFLKLGVYDRTSAAIKALRLGLVSA